MGETNFEPSTAIVVRR